MFVSNNKLENCGDGSSYARALSLERSLITKCLCSLASEFRDVSGVKDML